MATLPSPRPADEQPTLRPVDSSLDDRLSYYPNLDPIPPHDVTRPDRGGPTEGSTVYTGTLIVWC